MLEKALKIFDYKILLPANVTAVIFANLDFIKGVLSILVLVTSLILTLIRIYYTHKNKGEIKKDTKND